MQGSLYMCIFIYIYFYICVYEFIHIFVYALLYIFVYSFIYIFICRKERAAWFLWWRSIHEPGRPGFVFLCAAHEPSFCSFLLFRHPGERELLGLRGKV